MVAVCFSNSNVANIGRQSSKLAIVSKNLKHGSPSGRRNLECVFVYQAKEYLKTVFMFWRATVHEIDRWRWKSAVYFVKLEEARLAAPSPSGPDCRPEALQRKTPLGNGSCLVHCTSPDTRTPCASTTPLSNLPPSLPSQNDEERQRHPFTTAPPDPPSASSAIVQLENYICETSAQVVTAKAEWQSLVAAATRQRRAMSGMKGDNIEDILRIEEECVRLSAQVCHLQEQMDNAKAESKSRQPELLEEIEVLQSRVRRTFSPMVLSMPV
ncbi:hypothetical protein EDC04DRAFT_921866 [Pisolithus marmoratus]|nr:hypothetical protein EDC04DRAFT_921866 [Pisolithus marmoratus]